MKNSVLVVANAKSGVLVTPRTIVDKDGKKREVGVVMVQSKSLSSLSSLGRVSTRTAFITLEKEALDFLGDELRDGKPFPQDGKIVIEETLEPYVRKDGSTQEAKINPSTGEIITYNGSPVYRNSYFTEDMNAQDVFLRQGASVPAGADAPE